MDDLFDGWERAWSGRDPDAFAPLCVPDLHYEDPLLPAPIIGPEALARHARRLWRAFPDARLNATGARLSDGRFAAAPAKLLGTHTASLGRLAPTGRPLVVHVLVYPELEDGRLRQGGAFLDAYDAAVQLGVLPRRGTIGGRALLLLRGFGLRSP